MSGQNLLATHNGETDTHDALATDHNACTSKTIHAEAPLASKDLARLTALAMPLLDKHREKPQMQTDMVDTKNNQEIVWRELMLDL